MSEPRIKGDVGETRRSLRVQQCWLLHPNQRNPSFAVIPGSGIVLNPPFVFPVEVGHLTIESYWKPAQACYLFGWLAAADCQQLYAGAYRGWFDGCWQPRSLNRWRSQTF